MNNDNNDVPEEYMVITTFIDPVPARELAEWLESKGISAILTDTTPRFDASFANQTAVYEYQVRVPSSEVEHAQKLLEQANADSAIPEDHYLRDFTDDELFDVVRKKDEWSDIDYTLAQRLLAERGHLMDTSVIEKLQRERLAELAQPSKRQHLLVALGYLFVLLGGIPAIFIGLSLAKLTKKLPDGRKVALYQEADRRHGVWIYRLGILAFCLAAVVRILIAFVAASLAQ
ncbi:MULTISPECIES: hypothetical protein [unclassified Flavobacterium]|uniref:hypothetical protein n=1 Tax=unclassified Flavobacterium TaxID=196869 RepID=UPI001F13FF74|nr:MULTISPECIES: hypothetical protein [unclassified Flavobacterium]UMY65702.1 hypothetical protein MKO97_14550 [Flavobacterium sp. HJ-32-4]